MSTSRVIALDVADRSIPARYAGWINSIAGSSLAHRLAKGAFWSFAGSVVARGLSFAGSVYIARIIGKNSFGELGIVQNTLGMFGALAGFGLGLTSSKHVAELRGSDPARAGGIMALSHVAALASGSVMSIVLYVMAPLLAVRTLAAPQLVTPLRLGIILMFFGAMNGAEVGALSGFEAFATIARTSLWSGLAAFPLAIVGAIYWGVAGAVGGLAGSMALNWLFNHLALRREAARCSVPIKFRGCWSERLVLWHFSLPAVLAGLMVSPATWICNAMLVNRPSGYAEMGFLNAAGQCRNVLTYFVTVMTPALLPILASQAQEKKEEFQRVLNAAHKLTFLVILPLTIAMMVLASPLMGFYGHGFVGGRNVLIYTLAATAISCVGYPAGTALEASGKMWMCFVMNASWGAVFIATTFFLVNYGAKGVALAMLASYIFLTGWAYIYQRQNLPPGMLTRTFAGIGLVCAVTGVLVFL
jgi:O-antigen/teichoic acid export membrane protein